MHNDEVILREFQDPLTENRSFILQMVLRSYSEMNYFFSKLYFKSYIIYYKSKNFQRFSVFTYSTTCMLFLQTASPRFLCLYCVLRYMIGISASNYSPLLSALCGLWSMKRQHVSLCLVEKFQETPVSGNNSLCVCAVLRTRNCCFHPFAIPPPPPITHCKYCQLPNAFVKRIVEDTNIGRITGKEKNTLSYSMKSWEP